jgi:hypothetical protein
MIWDVHLGSGSRSQKGTGSATLEILVLYSMLPYSSVKDPDQDPVAIQLITNNKLSIMPLYRPRFIAGLLLFKSKKKDTKRIQRKKVPARWIRPKLGSLDWSPFKERGAKGFKKNPPSPIL